MTALLVALVLAVDPSLEVTSTSPPRAPLEVGVSSVPQLGLVQVDGHAGLSDRFSLELGGWNVFGTNTAGAYLRGGFLGGELNVLHTDVLDMTAGLRVFGAQLDVGASAAAGLSGRVATSIHVLPMLAVKPDFEASWLGHAGAFRFANELAVSLGEWRLGASGGVQGWVVSGADLVVAPAATLNVGYRHDFGPVAFDVSAVLAVARDASFITRTPVMATPNQDVGFQAGLRVAIISTSR
jgi:hypothetical protein